MFKYHNLNTTRYHFSSKISVDQTRLIKPGSFVLLNKIDKCIAKFIWELKGSRIDNLGEE